MMYRGWSIESEHSIGGQWTIYRQGNPYATKGGFKTIEDAKKYIDRG